MKIGFIGTGNMGGAILKGYAQSEASRGNEILLHNRTTEHNEAMAAAISENSRERKATNVRSANASPQSTSEYVNSHNGNKSNAGIRICNDNREIAEEADIIIIGVKPKDVPGVIREISPGVLPERSRATLIADKATADTTNVVASTTTTATTNVAAPGKIIVSMAAGVSISKIEEALTAPVKEVKQQGAATEVKQQGAATEETLTTATATVNNAPAKIIRIMPNTPAMVGQAMTSMSRNKNVSDEDFAKAKTIFDSVGVCEEVPEDMIDCVIGVSGSSPAYTYMYIEALAQAATDNGMEPETARIFAAQAVLGAAKMVLENKESLEQLRINVCSPGGTTIEAVNRLFANGFMDKVKEGFQAAVDRSKEMTQDDGVHTTNK